MRNRQRKSNGRLSGFTLTELMIVVTITGILATLAIPQLQRYKLRARAWQAEEFLQSISLHEEAYRAEFGRYIGTDPTCLMFPPGASCFNPALAGLTGDDQVFTTTPAWQQLGASPAGTVYYGFNVVVGTPANPPGAPQFMQQDFWWIAQARGDIDNDGTIATFELTSQSRRVWVSSPKGYD